ncbi:MAG: hypothetical protein JWQ72_3095 [Polaromonas sp.]|nr:hypothetical protein [Polaromonas sp.]
MKPTFVLAIAAVLFTSQAFALTAYEKNHGCSGDVGDCAFGGGNSGGGGGGDPGPATSMGAFGTADGGMVEFFSDSQGEWWIETSKNGDVQVGFDQDYGPKTKKKLPKGSKRPKYQAAEMTKGPVKTVAAAQATAKALADKAAADKAAADKAAADKAAADKLAADKAAALKAANYAGPTISASPGATGMAPAARKKP